MELFNRKSNKDRVISFLYNELSISSNQYRDEKHVENLIARQLKNSFDPQDVITQYSIGGNMQLKSDIDLFNGKVGIELKLAKQLLGKTSSQNIERLFGQVIYYSKLKYENNLIVLVVGTETEEKDARIKEINKFLDSLGLGISFVYKKLSRTK